MPLSLLSALFLAFGFDAPDPPAPLGREDLAFRAAMAALVMAAVAAVAFALGQFTAWRVARGGFAQRRLRRAFVWGTRGVELLLLGGFGFVVHWLEWPRVVRSAVVLPQGVPIVGEALVFLPFVVMQLACWWGLYAGERALRSGLAMGRPASAAGHVLRRARQTLGLVLPALVVFTLGQRLIEWAWPAWSAGAWGQALQVASMGALVLVLSPLFLRLAWPTHPLPPGPLRSRLEHLARRLGFRCTDILIWDTGQGVVNACVTGSLPWFRYVLLTDALVEYLDEHEVAAVFGHEIGHIAHRHLLYFGFFFAGSLGVLALLGKLVDDHPLVFADLLTLAGHPMLAEAAKVLTVLAAVLLYFLVVFGHVSRRFERQADVFGCRAVSCGQIDCPPHADLDGSGHLANASSGALCPVGIRIFANALASVASLNGIEPNARSWRHGSIARRIAFLEALEGEPAALRRFQAGVAVLRVIVAIALVGAVLLALATGSIDHLR